MIFNNNQKKIHNKTLNKNLNKIVIKKLVVKNKKDQYHFKVN